MALPRQEHPTFELTVPSTKKKTRFRAWLVKEQKPLLMALQAGETEITNAVRNTVDACTFGQLDVMRMPSFDLEYIFLQIRAKAVGEKLDLVLTCQHCEAQEDHAISLSDVQVHMNPVHKKVFKLSDTLAVEMNYPTTEQLNYLNANYSVETVFETICNCIGKVYLGDELFDASQEEMSEVVAFVETLTGEQLQQLEVFFATMPILKHVFTTTCPHCEKDTEYTLEGIEAFFA